MSSPGREFQVCSRGSSSLFMRDTSRDSCTRHSDEGCSDFPSLSVVLVIVRVLAQSSFFHRHEVLYSYSGYCSSLRLRSMNYHFLSFFLYWVLKTQSITSNPIYHPGFLPAYLNLEVDNPAGLCRCINKFDQKPDRP